MRKSVLKWYAAATLMLGAPALPSCSGITPRGDYRTVPNLVVNIDRSYANVVHKGEKEGIRDMRKLVEEPYYEEAWIFLPDESLWIETGFEETRNLLEKGEWLVVSELNAELERIFALNKNVVKYHIHLVPAASKSKIISFYIDSVAITMPIYDDIFTFIIHSDILYGYQPEGSITGKICSHYGVAEYFLTEEGKRRFSGAYSSKKSRSKAKSFSDNMFSELKSKCGMIEEQLWECAREYMKEKAGESHGIERLLENNDYMKESYESCAAKIPPRLAEEMSNKYITIRFTPYEKIFSE